MDSKRGEWEVWKVYQRKPLSPEAVQKFSRRPWGCVGGLATVLLLWQGLAAVLTALLAGQILPILILLLGHLPLSARISRFLSLMRKPCPDTEANAPFLGYLSERGIHMASGHLLLWPAFSGWAAGWEDPHVFRIHLQPSSAQSMDTRVQIRPKTWLYAGIASLGLAICLAVQLSGHAMALRACLYIAGLYLNLFLLRRWSRAMTRQSQTEIPEAPWVLIFDARKVSLAEVEALLERHLPRTRQTGY